MLEELTITIDEFRVEALTDALLEAGVLSVTIEDARADTADEQPVYGEPGSEIRSTAWPQSRIRVLGAYGSVDALVEIAATSIAAPVPTIESRVEVADTDWVSATQAQFAPIVIADRLWIVPTWHEVPAEANHVIRLDPGVAFGTGSHSTTRLCLQWLAEHEVTGARVLDVGCGSGILAMAAARFGAAEVVGTDIDRQALVAARDNAKLNGIPARYTEPSALAAGTFDIVLANILANPLMVLAPALLARLAAGGRLVLSGILERQVEQVVAVYHEIDRAVHVEKWRADDGWACLVGTRFP